MSVRLPALATAALCAALLAACGSAPPAKPGAPSESPGVLGRIFGPSLAPPLEAQRKRLADALRGTPVTVEGTEDGRLRVEVPLKYAFDPGRSVVKPPLAAVLNEVAAGLKPHAQAEVRVSGPADGAKGGAMLAQDRAASTRDYLVARGVPPTRFGGLGRASGEGVELLIADRGAPAAAAR